MAAHAGFGSGKVRLRRGGFRDDVISVIWVVIDLYLSGSLERHWCQAAGSTVPSNPGEARPPAPVDRSPGTPSATTATACPASPDQGFASEGPRTLDRRSQRLVTGPLEASSRRGR